ncbi:type I polyketide synthase [Crateriforma spongiae]|uniref:type I polyketide synthase n=1 Tax=Crateriforma spongiae TaxID=2724528 RepID=UPI0039B04A94
MPSQINDEPESGAPPADDLNKRLSNLSPAQRELLARRLREKAQSSSANGSNHSNGHGAADPSVDAHRSTSAAPLQDDLIAIVGIGCRLPGAPNPDAYWQLIESGNRAIREIGSDRWDQRQFFDATGRSPGKMSVDKLALIDSVSDFDPEFFGISPREASRMDPQQRLLLEVVWETFEDAGVTIDALRGSRTGVYVGIGGTDYSKVPSRYPDYFEHIDAHLGTGNALSIAAGRISYLFDLRGPSFIVDTACSSALVAIHQAVVSLRRRESDAAIAGGVNLILTPETTIAFSKARMLSPDGDCRPFDDDANGYVRGEGCGMVLMKRYTDAVRDGDQVYGVIRGSAINQDGRTSGITAPSSEAQVRCIREAMAGAKVTPDHVSYVEAHGTGTPLGDPIEMTALQKVFGGRAQELSPVRVGSVKGNIGHTETVSGVAGLLKVLQMFRHQQIPRQAGFGRLNRNIRLEDNRLKIADSSHDWMCDDLGTRIAGVSSFGFGGTNAHLIVQEAPHPHTGENGTAVANGHVNGSAIAPVQRNGSSVASNGEIKSDAASQLVVLSAKDDGPLQDLAVQYADRCDEFDAAQLRDFAATTTLHRSSLTRRLAVVGNSGPDIAKSLRDFAAQEPARSLAKARYGRPPQGRRPKLAMVFTGQGSQYVGMGQTLAKQYEPFRRSIDASSQWVDPHLPYPLWDVLRGDAGDIDHTSLAQPAICAIQCALVDVLRDRGLTPDVVAGHSIGEIAALYSVGAIDQRQAMLLATYRGKWMGDLPAGGTMAALLAPVEQVQQWIKQSGSSAVIAAMNGVNATVIAGTNDAVAELGRVAQEASVPVYPLDVSHAFHSPLMQPAKQPLEDELRRLLDSIHIPRNIRFASSLTGDWLEGSIDVDYWIEHLVSPVRFTDVMNRLSEVTNDLVIEVGPRPQLIGMLRRHQPTPTDPDHGQGETPELVSVLDSGTPDRESWLRTLGQAWTCGFDVDWKAEWSGKSFRRVALPLYPFARSRYWYDPPAKRGAAVGGSQVHPILGSQQTLAIGGTLFANTIRDRLPAFLADHIVSGSVTVPGAAWLESVLAAARQCFPDQPIALESFEIERPVFMQPERAVDVQIHVAPLAANRSKVQVSTAEHDDQSKADWATCASATVRIGPTAVSTDGIPAAKQSTPECLDEIPVDQFYQSAERAGLKYEPLFQVLRKIRVGHGIAIGELAVDATLESDVDNYQWHPVLLDGALQLIGAAIHGSPRSDKRSDVAAFLPHSIGSVHLGTSTRQIAKAEAVLKSCDHDAIADVVLRDDQGDVVGTLVDVTLRRLQRDRRANTEDPSRWIYQTQWSLAAEPDAGLSGDLPSFVWTSSGHAQDQQVGQEWLWVQPTSKCSGSGAISGNCDLAARVADQTTAVLDFIQAALKHSPPPRLSVITQAAFSIGDSTVDVDPVASAVAGLIRSATNECPGLRIRHLDVDVRDDSTAAMVRHWLASDDAVETESAIRDGQWWIPRLNHLPDALLSRPEGSELALPDRGEYRIRLDGTHRIEGLWAQRMPQEIPIDDEVRVRCRAVGLNFSDVLKSMDLYPGVTDQVVPLGIEVCGVVESVGPDVQDLRPGMRVMGVVPHGFASADRTTESLLTRVPNGLSDEEAAGVPIVFLTAHHALVNVGRLAAGEKVLIHAGAGGVGLAAIQVAQAVGADVYCTAGSEHKRQLLAQLGVSEDQIFDSRDLGSIEQIRRHSNGIDVVLNSLPGEWIDASIGLLRAHGRFLEIGKIDIYKNRPMGLLPFQDNLTYSAIDLDRLLRNRPDEVRELYRQVVDGFETGHYRPLPITRYRLDELPAAMRYMAARRNIGKIVVAPASHQDDLARQSGSHLISGGSGAIATTVARRLIQRGAKRVDLVARRPLPERVHALTQWARQWDATVVYHQADVTDIDSMQTVVDRITQSAGQLRGVIHAAGVLNDRLIGSIDHDSLSDVLSPKTNGTVALHQATRSHDLDYFTLLGSVASVFGSPAQSNYAAANAFLEGFAAARRGAGLPANVVHWGPWDSANGGMTDDAATQKNIAALGMRPLPVEVASDVLIDAATASAAPETLTVVDVDWRKMMAAGFADPGPSRLRGLTGSVSDDVSDSGSVDTEFLAVLDQTKVDSRLGLTLTYLSNQLAMILGMSADSIDRTEPLAALGLDSLMAIELKNNIEAKLDVQLPISRFVENPSLSTLAEAVLDAREGK